MNSLTTSLSWVNPTVLILGCGLVSLFIWTVLSGSKDPREPPEIKSWIPIFGHLIGFIRYGGPYFDKLSAQNPTYPLFSVSIFSKKIIIITDPNLIAAAQRARTLTFQPLADNFEKNVIGVSDHVAGLIKSVPGGPAGEQNSPYINERHASFQNPLRPGPALNKSNAAVLKGVADLINKIGAEWEEKTVWFWVRDSLTAATSRGLYGAAFPVARDPELIQALWDFDAAGFAMMSLPFHSITAPKGLAGRTKIKDCFQKWFDAGHYLDDDVSMVCTSRTELNTKYGLSKEEIGPDNIGMLFTATTNAIPTLYWMFLYVFSSPSLVKELREELQSVVTRDGDKILIDNTMFASNCPLLYSVYQETMRLRNVQPGVRIALKDTTISNSSTDLGGSKEYLLKKGSLIQTPSSISHTSSSIWGPTVHEFDPRRFMNLGNGDKDAEKLQKKSFIPFGGGKHLCPGRYFAFAEILGMIAVLVLGFEIEGTDGKPVEVGEGVRSMTNAVLKPTQEGMKAALRIRRRKGFENVEWGFATV